MITASCLALQWIAAEMDRWVEQTMRCTADEQATGRGTRPPSQGNRRQTARPAPQRFADSSPTSRGWWNASFQRGYTGLSEPRLLHCCVARCFLSGNPASPHYLSLPLDQRARAAPPHRTASSASNPRHTCRLRVQTYPVPV